MQKKTILILHKANNFANTFFLINPFFNLFSMEEENMKLKTLTYDLTLQFT